MNQCYRDPTIEYVDFDGVGAKTTLVAGISLGDRAGLALGVKTEPAWAKVEVSAGSLQKLHNIVR